ncbi:4645_t:CDS:2, partial [Gigaspora rosea]
LLPPSLISKDGQRMITWRQLKLLKGSSCKGRKANWFVSLEKKLLKNDITIGKGTGFLLVPRKIALKRSTEYPRKESLVLIPKIVNKENTKFLLLSLEQYQHSRQKNGDFSLESKIERVPLLWQDCLVEKPICSFVKTLLTWQAATRWRISSAIMAIEPNLNQTSYDWRSFWDLKKKQNGIHCMSLFQSKQLATQIKCLANKLPVLDELKKRKPTLYTSNECICCKVKATKTQDYLADCNYYEWSWINITKVAARVTWSKLSSTDQFLLPLKERCRLIRLWEKEEGITIKEQRSKAKKKHTFKGKVKIAEKEKTGVSNTNASSS